MCQHYTTVSVCHMVWFMYPSFEDLYHPKKHVLEGWLFGMPSRPSKGLATMQIACGHSAFSQLQSSVHYDFFCILFQSSTLNLQRIFWKVFNDVTFSNRRRFAGPNKLAELYLKFLFHSFFDIYWKIYHFYKTYVFIKWLGEWAGYHWRGISFIVLLGYFRF